MLTITTPLVLGVPLGQDLVTVLGILTLTVLMGLSAFFSSSEIAMFSLARHRIDVLLEAGTPGAETLADLKEDPHRLLVTILVGNNLVNIAMSSISTALVGFYFNPGTAVLVSTFGITSLVLLFGESGPKSYAVENTESWALKISRPLKYSERVLFPLVVTFDYLTRAVNRVTGGRAAIEDSYVTRDEIQEMIETGEREGVIEGDEREMLQRIFRLDDTIAKEVMTPRLDIDGVPKDASVEEAIQACVQTEHERLLVHGETLDTVVGVVSLRDLVREAHGSTEPDRELADLVRPVLHVPESKNVDDLLREMKAERIGLVVVIDEFGTTEGLITTEDITEEVVGEFLEGEEEYPVEFVDGSTVVVRGEVNVDEVNDALGVQLPEGEEFETIAGFVFNRAGRLVEAGETFTYEDVEIHVEQVENTRVTKVRIVEDASDDLVEAESDNREATV